MNVLITLPKHLLEKIMSGEKKFEMRKTFPLHMKIGEDGFFIVEKGTDKVRCWCRVDQVQVFDMSERLAIQYSRLLCVSPEYIVNYAPNGTRVYMWGIGRVFKLPDLCRWDLKVNKNPQSFTYCPVTYWESY